MMLKVESQGVLTQVAFEILFCQDSSGLSLDISDIFEIILLVLREVDIVQLLSDPPIVWVARVGWPSKVVRKGIDVRFISDSLVYRREFFRLLLPFRSGNSSNSKLFGDAH